MKAILEFTLPEDQAAFAAAQRGERYLGALRDVSLALRDRVKYGQHNEATVAMLTDLRLFLYQLVPDLDGE